MSQAKFKPYRAPAGGWGSAYSVGNILIREKGSAAPFVEVGNCSALTLSPQENVLQQQDYTKPGGGLRNQVRRVTGVDMAYTFHDFAAENFARSLRAAAQPVPGRQ